MHLEHTIICVLPAGIILCHKLTMQTGRAYWSRAWVFSSHQHTVYAKLRCHTYSLVFPSKRWKRFSGEGSRFDQTWSSIQARSVRDILGIRPIDIDAALTATARCCDISTSLPYWRGENWPVNGGAAFFIQVIFRFKGLWSTWSTRKRLGYLRNLGSLSRNQI